MKIKLDSLIITEYCSQDKRKIRFIKEISNDQLINHFVSSHLQKQLEESEGTNKIDIGHTYIIEDKRKLVGFIRLAFMDFDGVLQLHYGVHPDFRRQQYGTKILKETSNYILKTIKPVKKIELYINQQNKGSIKCAENAMFKLEREFKSPKSEFSTKVYMKKEIV